MPTAKPFRRIVVAYDGSASAEDALALALRLRDGSAVTLFSPLDEIVDLSHVDARHVYGPVQRALLGSVSEELIARARHPVLVIPRQPGPDHG